MSKSSKAAAKDRNRKEKRAKKAAQQAKYDAWRNAGTNSKSKRFLSSNRKRASMTKHEHQVSKCGNAGCKKCFPRTPSLRGVKPIPNPYLKAQETKIRLGILPPINPRSLSRRLEILRAYA